MYVLKFGGTSVGTPQSINTVFEIVKDQKTDHLLVCVVSAFSGVTNQLQLISELAQKRDPKYQEELENLRGRHKQIIAELLEDKAAETEELIMPLLLELAEIIHGTYLLRECSPRSKDLILSFGERLSATIIASFFRSKQQPAEFCDARFLIQTDDEYGSARINFETTNELISRYFQKKTNIQVTTGFIASTSNGVTTTLGRGGSDYTASVIAAALNVAEIQIWTDVNGVMTTNPSLVPSAFSLEHLTYEEAMELSHFGAKVLHPPTIQPALEKNIPIRILNTFDRAFKGTVISRMLNEKVHGITGLTAIDNVALLTIQGSGMVGVPGIAARLFQALAQRAINIILITQASSEHSICVAVKPEDAKTAKKVIESEFRHEIKAHEMNSVETEMDLSVIAVVGQNMRRVPGIAGKIFDALGKNSINVVAVSQGSSELNISIVVNLNQQRKALNVIHDAFYIAKDKLAIYLAGKGLIGSALLQQISELKNPDLTVCGIMDSKKLLINEKGINTLSWQSELANATVPADPDEIITHVRKNIHRAVFVDCTANEDIANSYESFLQNGIAVVAANKIANTMSIEKFKKLKQFSRNNKVSFFYETNVGAGLPVIETLQSLIRSGDEIDSIEAILSGTLSFIFNTFKTGTSFHDVVREAKQSGYTEPDPRIDLSGMDVARKILILARECGASLELKDIRITNFLPEASLKADTIDRFFESLKENEAVFQSMIADAEKEKKVLRYIASFKENKIEIGIQSVSADHAFYSLNGTDNIVAFKTKRYNRTPLVIKGPGAGAEVTAAGVLNDILKVLDN
ncbi:MAG: bifunctional aspartate kinase/homoserine dehydrogenase I [Calditrichae bacterium]|nr:bifunctional aspartate kinase/homoserine dehydrogenase I [Calditrichia bacterium]